MAIVKKKLSDLADLLINKIKEKKDFFITTTIVFPNLFIEQWFKSYWLRKEGENVLMNVECLKINDILPKLTHQANYKLIKKSTLTQIIISILVNNKDKYQSYLKYIDDNPIKLYDLSSSLADLLLGYYQDDFEGLNDFESNDQFKLYKDVVDVCSKHNFGTIDKIEAKPFIDENTFFFGFNKFDKVYENLFKDNNNVYRLEVDENSNSDYVITSAPSKLKEIQNVHSIICQKLLDKKKDIKLSDFLIVGSDINEYLNDIERVFKQNDEEYPNIPYVIRSRLNIDNDVILALKILFKIGQNKYFTRLDFYNLVTNSLIKKVRNIDDDEIADWVDTILALNIYRNHDYLDDWTYLKKRLLLSKVSSINFSDNIVELKDESYLPYSNIGLNDDSILKLVKVIDDLNSFIDLFNNYKTISNDVINLFKVEFDKWFSTSGNENETNFEYIKILDVMNVFLELGNTSIPINTFFYSLLDCGTSKSFLKGTAFTSGVTFSDFDINSIASAKYIFFIGGSSNNLPKPIIKNELDLRINILNNDEQIGIKLLYQNADRIYFSYVNKDLQNDVDYYISPLIGELNKAKRNIDYNTLPLDETRPYEELFTLKEFVDKDYYYNLLDSKPITESSPSINNNDSFIFYESVTVSQMDKYLKEPLSYKVSRLFTNEDDTMEQIKNEWEPFTLNHLKELNAIQFVITQMILNNFDFNTTFKTFKNNNAFQTINEEYEQSIYQNIVNTSKTTVQKIKEITNDNYEILEPTSIKLINKDNREWMLTSSSYTLVSIDDFNRTYIELKEMKEEDKISKFLKLYVTALMDISSLGVDANIYHVKLANGSKPKSQKEFDVTPFKAKEILNNIHDLMGDFTNNKLIAIDHVTAKIETLDDLINNIINNSGPWQYFKHKDIFDYYLDLGYQNETFTKSTYIDALNEHIKNVLFLPKIEEKKEEDNNGK